MHPSANACAASVARAAAPEQANMPTPVTRSLQRYRAKRDFGKTSEPAGAPRKSTQQLEFVIQRHHARRLHYDFRLEWDGVLKSWAVPKGPSLDPSEKRLAVQVEDHPFEYRKFSGDIPAGEYGAGHVIIWDRGTWVPDGDVDRGLNSGKLDFRLQGERLHGKWSLIRLKDGAKGRHNWLLIKQRDADAAAANSPEITEVYTEDVDVAPQTAARTKARSAGATRSAARGASKTRARATVAPQVERAGGGKPASAARAAVKHDRTASKRIVFIAPQLATGVAEFPSAGRWVAELKFDGYRILAYIDGERVHCFSRSGLDWTHRMPDVAATLKTLDLRDAWLDGELIALDEKGLPQFQRLQQALDPLSREKPLLMVFDILQLMGDDLRAKPLHERRRLLEQSLASLGRDGAVRLVDVVDDASPALRDRALRGRLRRNHPQGPGRGVCVRPQPRVVKAQMSP
jgi:bifunctional non-homologous end joining protein LigD